MRLKQRLRIFFKKARRAETELEEQAWEIENESLVGFRTIKTALSIFVCLMVYQLIQPYGITDASDSFLACVTAIICMKDSVDESVKIGAHRLVGTLIGAVFGLVYLYAGAYLHNPYLHIILLSLTIIILITICTSIKCPQAVVICCVVFLFISMNQVNTSPLVHSAKRFADTAVGLVVSFLINKFLFNPENRPDYLDEENDADKQKDDF